MMLKSQNYIWQITTNLLMSSHFQTVYIFTEFSGSAALSSHHRHHFKRNRPGKKGVWPKHSSTIRWVQFRSKIFVHQQCFNFPCASKNDQGHQVSQPLKDSISVVNFHIIYIGIELNTQFLPLSVATCFWIFYAIFLTINETFILELKILCNISHHSSKLNCRDIVSQIKLMREIEHCMAIEHCKEHMHNERWSLANDPFYG